MDYLPEGINLGLGDADCFYELMGWQHAGT